MARVIRGTQPGYGSTGRSPESPLVPTPPPYSELEPRSRAPVFSANWWEVGASSPTLLRKAWACVNTWPLVVLLTFVITVVCMSTMLPITSCNDPADPMVRERIREEWSKDLLEHEKQVAEREVVKARWAWEGEQHAALLREWEEEGVRHERALKERTRREEEERKQLHLSWGRVETHQCKTYGMREYTAVLMNLPTKWERRVEACKTTPLEIHGIAYLPKNCEIRGRGLIVGRWEIDQYEPDCNAHWGWYKDKGCTSHGSGKRRIEHYLENLPKGGDWREFCATTPVRFHEMQFAGAQECYQYNSGTYGLWEIDDATC